MACLGKERSFSRQDHRKGSLGKWLLERARGSFPGLGNNQQRHILSHVPLRVLCSLVQCEAISITLKRKVRKRDK